jgi:hypothetical protein
MTLVVSLRVPDGVVLAADSLQTSQVRLGINIPAPKGQQIPMPSIMMPTSTSSYAQKLFSFRQKFGVATFGSAIINQRTIYNHIKSLELESGELNSVKEVAEKLKEYFTGQLNAQLETTKQRLQPNQLVMGVQIVGFESSTDYLGHTVEVAIGEKPTITSHDGIGCTISGDSEVVRKLWEIGKQNQMRQTNYGSFSLKDAVDYVEFLINTTSSFQRFANMIPTVGGAVDIALVTHYSQFKWIKYKELTRLLEDQKLL